MDQFEVEAVSLGDLKRAVVSHDGDGSGEGWYCEQILVRDSEEATHEWVFACSKYVFTNIIT